MTSGFPPSTNQILTSNSLLMPMRRGLVQSLLIVPFFPDNRHSPRGPPFVSSHLVRCIACLHCSQFHHIPLASPYFSLNHAAAIRPLCIRFSLLLAAIVCTLTVHWLELTDQSGTSRLSSLSSDKPLRGERLHPEVRIRPKGRQRCRLH